ncbi:hypothetical protein ONZ45_g13998 [Pleurotus djamor]|nr:hypothetical protein ONZ45_g13998 [Pleurotus djamor]
MLLPVDVVHHIIKHVAAFNRLDCLSACSLVCHDWLPLAQRYIWAEFYIQAPRDDPARDLATCRRILELIQRSPHLALYVRQIRLQSIHVHTEVGMNTDQADFDIVLCELLGEFCNVEEVYLSGVGDSHWLDLPVVLLQAFAHVLSQPRIATLTLRNWIFRTGGADLRAVLRKSAKSLKTLRLLYLRCRGQVSDVTVASQPVELLNLVDLTVVEIDVAAVLWDDDIVMPNLQEFHREVCSKDQADKEEEQSRYILYGTTVPLSVPSLRLHFNFWKGEEDCKVQDIDFGPYVNMQHLHIVIPSGSYRVKPLLVLRHLSDFILQISADAISCLESITVDVAIPSYDFNNTGTNIANPWETLIPGLARLLEYGNLRKIEIVLRDDMYRGEDILEAISLGGVGDYQSDQFPDEGFKLRSNGLGHWVFARLVVIAWYEGSVVNLLTKRKAYPERNVIQVC